MDGTKGDAHVCCALQVAKDIDRVLQLGNSGGMHITAQARDSLGDVRPCEDTQEEECAHDGAVLAVFFGGGQRCPWDGRRHWTWVVGDLAV